MFAVLQVVPYEKGIIKSIGRLFKSKEAEISYCAVKGAAPFIELKVYETSNGINWNEVRRCIGICSERLLVPEGMEVPKNSGIQKFTPSLLPIIMIFNNFLTVIKALPDAAERSVTVFDKHGALTQKIDMLLNYVRHVTVLTDDIDTYRTVSQRIMDNMGAAVVVLPYDSAVEAEQIVVADRYDIERMRKSHVVFCPDKLNCYSNLIFGNNMAVNGQYIKTKPDNINCFDFVCALYELNSLHELAEMSFSQLYFNGDIIEEGDILKMLSVSQKKTGSKKKSKAK